MADRIWYCTRDIVQGATDQTWSPRDITRLDRAIAAASDATDAICHRRFFPWTGTITFDWPDQLTQPGPNRTLWLGQYSIHTPTSITSGGTVIPSSGYILRGGLDDGASAPYSRIEIDQSSSYAWEGGTSGSQQSIMITGIWGWNTQTPAASLAEDLDLTETGVDITSVTDPSRISVGTVLTIGSERMTITDTRMITTGQALTVGITASSADTLLTIASTAAISPGQIILIGSERMLVTDVTPTTMVVRRAHNGTALAIHAISSTVYAPWSLVVSRGATGSTVATHTSGTAITAWVPPALVEQHTISHAVAGVSDMAGAYARPAGSGSAVRPETTGAGLYGLASQLRVAYGRSGRGM
jgi:hypothetical protein